MSLFTHIKNRISILEVVSSYATLKKTGLYYKGVCPFHYEKTASFTVSPAKEIFYCFGCQAGGDVIAFVAKAEHCSQIEGAKWLIERYNIEVPDELLKKSTQSLAHQSEKHRYHNLCRLVENWLHEQLKYNKTPHNYLLQRGFNQQVIDQYRLGFFPSGRNAIRRLIEYISHHKFLLDDLLKAHIVSESKTTLYSPFEDRIMFPIRDHLGNTCGFGGRTYQQRDERPKYFNSKEHNHFHKGTLLFGFDCAKKSIQQMNSAILVEGYTDAIALAQYGYTNVLATLGTACTVEHLKMIARFADTIYIMYDSDQAGTNAVLRLTQLCWQVNVELKITQLPNKHDPASFITEGGKLQSLFDQAHDIFSFLVKSFAHTFKHQSLHQKLEQLRSFLSVISNIQDTLKQDIILSQAAQQFEIPIESLQKALHQWKNNQSQSSAQSTQPEEKSENPTANKMLKEIPLLEKKLFYVILNNTKLVSQEEQEYLETYLSDTLCELYKKFAHLREYNQQADFVNFFELLNEQEKIFVSRLVLECHEYEEANNYQYLLEQFQKKTWKSFVNDTKIRITRARNINNNHELQKILNHFQKLKKKLLHRGLI